MLAMICSAGPRSVAARHVDDADAAKSLAAAHASGERRSFAGSVADGAGGVRKAQLKMDQVAPPYYIEYRVSDVEEFLAEAAFGALRENQKVHVRVMRVVVRVGDYKQDSYIGEGMGQTTILPLDQRSDRAAAPDLAGDG